MGALHTKTSPIYTCLKPSIVMIVAGLYASVAQAENISGPVATLPTIVVTATKTDQPIDKVTTSVQVIDQETIEKLGSISLKDIVNKTPGLITQYGTFPSGSSASKSSISLRGMGASGTLWLIDGRRIAGEVKNPYDMDRIPASMIERIEIVKGPMSALYGSDAVGGVINIISKNPSSGLHSQVSVSAGANQEGDGGNRQLSASIQGNTGDLYGSLYASTHHSTPYTEVEKTHTRVGRGYHAPQGGLPAIPGFLNPKSPTGGRPFYLQADGTVKPKPLDPSKLATDIEAVKSDFSRFKSQASHIQNQYEVPVTYREDAEVDTVGGRLEYDVNADLTLGAEFNWFQETREGQYRGAFHPMAYMPPIGSPANPIAGHDVAGNPIGKRRGALPAFDVPINSYDDNNRLDLGVDAHYDITPDADLTLRIYNSEYEKRNRSTLTHYSDFGFPNENKSALSGMAANVDITSYELSGNWQFNDTHLITSGVEYRDEKREATVFSQSQDFDIRQVSYLAAYLQDDFRMDDSLGLTFGGRYDQYRQDRYTDEFGHVHDDHQDSQATFRLGAVKNISDAVNIRANFAQGYRVPDIREQFIQKQTPTGMQLGAQTIDPRFDKQTYDLQPESTTSYELAVFGQQAALDYAITAFYNDIEDRISQVTRQSKAGANYYTFENISGANTYGVELSLDYPITSDLDASLDWTELRTENDETGEDLEFNPERMVTAAVDWQVSPRLNLGVNAKHIGEQHYQNGNDLAQTDAYTVMNINGGYKLGAQQQTYLFAGIDNLFDSSVDKKLGSDVGPYYYAGLKYEF